MHHAQLGWSTLTKALGLSSGHYLRVFKIEIVASETSQTPCCS